MSELINQEIHITVDGPASDELMATVQKFNGKLIVVDGLLQGQKVITHTMTSWTGRMTSYEAVKTANIQANVLRNNGFEVIRVKVESEPHPSVLRDGQYCDGAGSYFESHIGVIHDGKSLAKIEKIGEISFIRPHISKNPIKILEDGNEMVMMTIRASEFSLDDFMDNLIEVQKCLEEEFVVGPPIIEYAHYDSNVGLDKKWMEHD